MKRPKEADFNVRKRINIRKWNKKIRVKRIESKMKLEIIDCTEGSTENNTQDYRLKIIEDYCHNEVTNATTFQ